MAVDAGHPPFQRRPPLTVERRFQGSVFDVADARRFARMTASWWGIEPGPVEQVVDELSRRAVCSERPGFCVSLTLDGGDVRVRVVEVEPGAPVPEDPSQIRTVHRDSQGPRR